METPLVKERRLRPVHLLIEPVWNGNGAQNFAQNRQFFGAFNRTSLEWKQARCEDYPAPVPDF